MATITEQKPTRDFGPSHHQQQQQQQQEQGQQEDEGGDVSPMQDVGERDRFRGSNDDTNIDPMDVTTESANVGGSSDSGGGNNAMAPPPANTQAAGQNATKITNNKGNVAASMTNGGPGASSAASTSSSAQPKVVQTAFIHKLYNMLEDNSIAHLICWSSSSDSFLISPTAEFAKVLATYFKHTNISSFVRQLNMYGFHKVSDVFHTGNPESPLWEFKHGNNNFKRGDLAGLKEIKRRASRQTLTHRDSAPNIAKATQMTGVPPPPQQMGLELPADPVEARFAMLESSVYDMHGRLARSEDMNVLLSTRCQLLTECATKCLELTYDLSSYISRVINDPEHHTSRSVFHTQGEISRQLEALRNTENLASIQQQLQQRQQPPLAFAEMMSGAVPVSPYHLAMDDSRRGSTTAGSLRGPWRTSIGSQYPPSPSRGTAQAPPSSQQQGQRPASPTFRTPQYSSNLNPTDQRSRYNSITHNSPPMHLPRRHTSGDVTNPDWPLSQRQQPPLPSGPSMANAIRSPFASGQSSAQWPSSPRQHLPGILAPPSGLPGQNSGYQQIRETLANYQLGGRTSARTPPKMPLAGPSNIPTQSGRAGSRPQSPSALQEPAPPPPPSSHGPPPAWSSHFRGAENGSWGRATGAVASSTFRDNIGSSLPASRRSSMAHILNPAETAENPEEEEAAGG